MNVINDYLHPERYPKNHAKKFAVIRAYIADQLADYPNFAGVDFCDVSAGGIQIRGHHKEVVGYTYGPQITILYDFSNAAQAAIEFVAAWKNHDEPARLAEYQSFLEAGQKWGWD